MKKTITRSLLMGLMIAACTNEKFDDVIATDALKYDTVEMAYPEETGEVTEMYHAGE